MESEGKKNSISVKNLSAKVNMIVALDTEGRVYSALTQINTDSNVMVSFLSRLAIVLDAEDRNWRRDTIWLLDGARYHTSKETRQILYNLGVNYIFSAPYSYDAAPVELYFSYFKQKQINPDNEKQGKK